MTSTTETTRTFVTNLFNSISQEGLGPKFVAALSDDVIWKATGSSPLSGVFRSKATYQNDVLGRLKGRLEYAPKPQVNRILADGDWAAVYFHSKGARSRQGLDFGMEYCWLLKVQREQIVEVVGFFDQHKVAQLFEETD
jgi:uncharacterized protein